MTDVKQQFDILDKILARNIAWVASADSKATLLFAVDTAMLGALAALVPNTNLWTAYSIVATTLASVALLLSVGFLVTAMFPRLSGPRGSSVYFAGIAAHNREDYVSKVLKQDDVALLADFASQCHRSPRF